MKRGVACRMAVFWLLLLPILAVSSMRATAQASKTLNIYNWSDYIAAETIPAFQKSAGITVNYDTYDSNDLLEGKLSAGNSTYDLVVPTLTPFLARQIKAGFYQKLDKSKLPNWVHLDKGLLERMAKFDPGNEYAIPWMTATTGIGYNPALIKARAPDAPLDSLALLFDPANLAKFKDCGVSILDSPTDVFPPVLAYLGLDPNSHKKEDLQKATEALLKLRPYITKFDSGGYINDLANGDSCIVWGYSSDVILARRRAREAGKGVTIAYVIPKEGSQRYIDTFAIPKDAPHPDAALAFLNYVMDPKVVAATTNAIGVRSGNADAAPFTNPDITSDAGIYPPSEVEAKLYSIEPASPEFEKLRTRLWERVRAGQ